MPNISEKKKKLLYLLKILLEKTDSDHAITLPQILEELEGLGIPAERKSIYDDIETLRSVGVEIETKKSRNFQYYIEKRHFSLPELQTLAEAVRSAEFISKSQENTLIRKLCWLCSAHQAGALTDGAPAPAPAEQEEKPGVKIVLEFAEDLLDPVTERFGPGLTAEPAGKNRLRAAVHAQPDAALFAWLFQYGTAVKLAAPKKLAEQFRERAKAVAKLYKS